MLIGYRCLHCCESRNRNAEREAGNIVKTNLVAELYGVRVAAVLTFYRALIRANLFAHVNCRFHELADACLVSLSTCREVYFHK